jgi:predicted dehydrogenase
MERIKAAVVGAGIFGDTHCRVYSESPIVDLAWVCDQDQERAKQAAQRYNCNFTTDLQEITNDPSISIVSVATPDFAHRDISLKVIEAGKNLIVEKPLATNIEDAQAITDAVKRKGVKFMTDFQNRWNAPFIQAKQNLESGKYGEPVSAYIRLANSIMITKWLSWSAKSGPQWFLGPHIVDLVCWLYNQKPIKVFATGKRKVLKSIGYDTYDALQAQIIFKDSFATIDTSWIVPKNWPSLDFRMDILTTNGKMELEPTFNGISMCADEGYQIPFIGGRQDGFDRMFGFFKEPILHFIDHVVKDIPCLVGVEDGLINTKIVVAIEKSIESGKIIELNL